MREVRWYLLWKSCCGSMRRIDLLRIDRYGTKNVSTVSIVSTAWGFVSVDSVDTRN